MIGSRLNHYEILSKLGTGGMGEVYAAEDTRLHRKVAIKILPEDLAADPERRQRFEREAQAIAALNHPNIVTIYSVEEADGLHFIVMEMVEGKLLSEIVPEEGLGLDEFFKLAVPLVDALDAAHKRGITHRDLKPGNIMVTGEGRVKVLDFGLAKLADREAPLDAAEAATVMASSDLTEQGQILGTVTYMSPEQAEGRPVDHRSDIFSLGVVLYEMATGEAPFQGDTKISIITSIMRDTPPPVSEINHDLPQHLGRVINRSMAKKPERRYQSTTDLRNELEDLKTEMATSELRESALRLQPADGGRRGLAYAAFGGLALVGIVALAMMIGGRFLGSGTAPAGTTASTGKPSLAVLYFENLSGDQNLDWLRTGLTDMLVTDLAQSPNLQVLGTDRLHQILSEGGWKDAAMTSSEIVEAVSQQGHVDNVLLGSFARAGNTIRISARLQEAASGTILGSDTVEGVGEESIFPLVDDLTRRIKQRFDMPAETMTADVDTDLTDVTTDSVEAYRYYSEGLMLHEELREEEAIERFEKAVELDPDFAMALAKLSIAHGNIGDTQAAREFSAQAMQHLDRVNDRERYYIEGRHYSMDQETIERSIEAYQKAVDAYPDHTAARNNLAQQLMRLDRYDEAIAHFQELRAQGNRFPGTYHSLATAYGMTGRFAEGEQVLRDYVAQNPDNAAGYVGLGAYLAWAGRYPEALQAIDRGERLGARSFDVLGARWQTQALAEDWPAARETAAALRAGGEAQGRDLAALANASMALFAGALDGAEERFEEVGGSPALAEQGLSLLAAVQLDTGDWDGALATAARQAEVPGDEVGARLNSLGTRALALAGRGDADGADAIFADMWAQAQQLSLPRRLLDRKEKTFRAELAFYSGDWRDVLGFAVPVLADMPPREELGSPDNTRLQYLVGVARFETGAYAAAETNFLAMSQLTGRIYQPILFVRSLWYLGRIYEERGDTAKARRYYGAFVDHWSDGEIDRQRVAAAQRFLARISGGRPSATP